MRLFMGMFLIGIFIINTASASESCRELFKIVGLFVHASGSCDKKLSRRPAMDKAVNMLRDSQVCSALPEDLTITYMHAGDDLFRRDIDQKGIKAACENANKMMILIEDETFGSAKNEIPKNSTGLLPQGSLALVKTDEGNLHFLTFRVKVNKLVIQKVTVNRGNCSSPQQSPLPRATKFGDSFQYGIYICNPIEVMVMTDHGSETFVWND